MRTRVPHARRRGASLLVVMVVVLLTSLLVLGAARTALLHDKVIGSDSDHQRALESAHAALRDAERSIRGEGTDDTPCPRDCGPAGPESDRVSYPRTEAEFMDLKMLLAAETPSCMAGICAPDKVSAAFWDDKTSLDAMKKKAIATGRSWYWVELLPYDTSAALAGGAAQAFAPDSTTPWLYRITVVAEGLKPGTRTVLRTVIAWKKSKS